MSEHRKAAGAFLHEASRGGWQVEARRESSGSGWVVTVQKWFEPGDGQAYVAADSEAYGLLARLRMVYPGTTWGTTSDGVGGHAGLTGGYYRLSKSGVSGREGKALADLLAK